MQMSENINELATALAKAQGEMKNAGKTSDNPFFKSKYADLAEILNAVREPLSKYGLSISQLYDGMRMPDKTITVTAYCETKEQSRLLDEYITRTNKKLKRVIQKV